MAFDENTYNKQYKKDTYKRILVQLRKDDELLKRLEFYQISCNKPMNDILKNAIKYYLDKIEK